MLAGVEEDVALMHSSSSNRMTSHRAIDGKVRQMLLVHGASYTNVLPKDICSVREVSVAQDGRWKSEELFEAS